LHNRRVRALDEKRLTVLQRDVRDSFGSVFLGNEAERACRMVTGRVVARDHRFVEDRQALLHRLGLVDAPDRVGVIDGFESPQARGQDARPGAVPRVDQRVVGKQATEDRVAAAAAQRVAEHENVATAQPRQRNSGQLAAKALLIVKVVAKVQLGDIESEVTERSAFSPSARPPQPPH